MVEGAEKSLAKDRYSIIRFPFDFGRVDIHDDGVYLAVVVIDCQNTKLGAFGLPNPT